MRELLLASVALGTLAACGGSGSSTPDPVVFAPALGNLGGEANGQIEESNDGTKIVIDVGTVAEALDIEASRAVGSFSGAYTLSGDVLASAFVSETSTSRVGIIATHDNSPGAFAAQFARLEETTLPTSGTATFLGDYVGYQARGNNNVWRATGSAEMNVDFENSSIDGEINNRVISTLIDGTTYAGYTTEDILLEETDFDAAGVFDGTISGGTISNGSAGETVGDSSGTYSGLIAGDIGQEIVGGVSFAFDRNGEELREAGVFATGH